MQKSWFVVKEINIWEFVPEFSQYLWVNKERTQVTPSRDDEEKANEAIKQSQEQTAKDVQEIMSQSDKEEEVK